MLSEIIVNSPWYFFVLSLALATGLSLWLYYKNKKNIEVSRFILRGLLLLRFLSTATVTFLLLSIAFKSTSRETENPIILLAIDNSSSMVSAEDSAFVKSEFLASLNKLTATLGKKYSVKTLLFGDQAATGSEPDFGEKETDIDALLNLIENNYANQNVGALIVASDGLYNKGANPIYSAEKLGFPIYTIAMGDTNEIRDVQIQKINHNEVVYAGNNFPVEVIIQANKFKGKEVRLSLWQNTTEKASQIVKINSDAFLTTCTFTQSAQTSGIVKYAVQITALEGEKNTHNNRQTFVVESIDNKEKILLLANEPHPDLSALREVLSGSANYEVEEAYFSEFTKPLNAYSLVIFHGFSASQFKFLEECREKAIPFWLINPKLNAAIPGIKMNGASVNQFDDTEPYLNNTFGLFTMSNEFKQFMPELPAVSARLGFYPVSNGSDCLIKQKLGAVETENPILFFGESQGVKFASFIADGLWKWRFKDFDVHKNHLLFSELISKTVQYLSVKSDKSFFRLNGPKIIYENQNLEFEAEVYNKSYELITEPEVTLVLTNSDNKKFNYVFSKTNRSFHLNIGLLSPGEYSYEATVRANDQVYIKKGVLVVKEIIAEKINTVANHQVLFQMSHRSGAKLFYPAGIKALQEELINNERIKPITYTQSSTSALIELKWLFWIILLILATEWFFRKRYLSI